MRRLSSRERLEKQKAADKNEAWLNALRFLKKKEQSASNIDRTPVGLQLPAHPEEIWEQRKALLFGEYGRMLDRLVKLVGVHECRKICNEWYYDEYMDQPLDEYLDQYHRADERTVEIMAIMQDRGVLFREAVRIHAEGISLMIKKNRGSDTRYNGTNGH